MPPKLTPDEWLRKYVRIVSELGDSIVNSDTTISYPPHTVLKVIAVYYYAQMFALIATGRSAKSKGYDGAVYLDLFAGPGIVTVDGSGDRVAGSPIAATSTKNRFDYSVFVEINQARAAALRKRLSTYLEPDEFEVIHGDSNALVSQIIDSVKTRFSKPIVFAFVDPQGMEAKWSTATALSEGFGSVDFMLNVTSGAARVAGRIQGGAEGDRPIFEDFFGKKADEVLTKMNEGIKVESQYEEAVKEVLGREKGETISICDIGNHVVYHLMCYTRQSWTGSPWAEGFKAAKNMLERFDGNSVSGLLDVLKGRQRPL